MTKFQTEGDILVMRAGWAGVLGLVVNETVFYSSFQGGGGSTIKRMRNTLRTQPTLNPFTKIMRTRSSTRNLCAGPQPAGYVTLNLVLLVVNLTHES
jgi:hypothetical protein